MPIIATAIGKPASGSGVAATAHAGFSDALDHTAEATISDPASGNVLQVGVHVLVGAGGGQRVDQYMEDGTWSFDQAVQQAGAAASLPRFLPGAYKDMRTYRSSPGGMDFWYLHLAIRGAGGNLQEYPLMSAALAQDGTRTYDTGGATENFTLADRLTRFRGTPATVYLRAGHNLPTWRVIERLAAAAGWTGINIPRIGIRHRRPVQVVNGDWFGLAQVIAEAQGLHLYVDGDGFLTAAEDRPEQGRPAARWDFGSDDVVESVDGNPVPVVLTPPSSGTVLHKVCITSIAQVARDTVRPETVELTSESFGFFAPVAAPWLQGAGGSRTFQSFAEIAAAERLRRASTTTITRRADAVLSVREKRRGYYNPVAAARVLNADGTIASYRSVYQEEDEDTSPAHPWPSERLIEPVTEATVGRTYDGGGYLSRVVEESYGYRHIERAIRSRASQSDSWETATGPAGLLVLSDGVGVVESVEQYRLLERVITDYDQVDGYQTWKRTTTYRYHRRKGWQYLYADGSLSSDEREQFRKARVREERWISLHDEGLTLHQWQIFGPDGNLAKDIDENAGSELLEGEPPAAERVEDLSPDVADFDTLEEWRDALAASRWETREMISRRTWPRPGHPYAEQETNVDYVETQAGLDAHATRLLLKSASMGVQWTALPTPGLTIGDTAHLRVPAQLRLPGASEPIRVDLDDDVYITGLRYTGGQGAAVLLELEGRI